MGSQGTGAGIVEGLLDLDEALLRLDRAHVLDDGEGACDRRDEEGDIMSLLAHLLCRVDRVVLSGVVHEDAIASVPEVQHALLYVYERQAVLDGLPRLQGLLALPLRISDRALER